MTDLTSGQGVAALLSLPGVGAKRALLLADAFGTWEALTAAGAEEIAAVIGNAAGHNLHGTIPPYAPDPDLPDGVRIISIREPDYPAILATIPDPPPLLWVAGTLPDPNRPALAVVGTRHPTGYGQAVTTMTAAGAIEHGIQIISGLALGVDSLAHQAAVDAAQPTWAILGQGVDTLGAHGARTELAQQILLGGGGLIAEVPCGTPVAGHQLTRRNRLQSGLSDATVIAQSGIATPDQPAGTMHTARYAIQQHRLLVVARPSGTWASEDRSAGNLALTDPTGMDPALVYATGQTAETIAARRPVADVTIHGRDDLPGLYQAVRERYDARGATVSGSPEPVPALF